MVIEFKSIKEGYTGTREWPSGTEIPLEVFIYTEDLQREFDTKPWNPFLISPMTKYAILAKLKVLDNSIQLTSLTKPPVTVTLVKEIFQRQGLGGGIRQTDQDHLGRFIPK